jgi:alpha-1,2-mannosyltransferase
VEADALVAGAEAGVSGRRPWLWAGLTVLIFVSAVGCRLLPVLRGGGLFGLGSYQDGVYYAAAAGLINGRMPYGDFLLLQPPGIVALLAPFALVGELSSDSSGFAAARAGWMLLGGLNAVLITRILRPLGLGAALIGGLSYALSYPAIQTEHTVTPEAAGTTTVLVALLALRLGDRTRWMTSSGQRLALLGAGVALGFGAGIRISGILACLIVLGWHFAPRRIRGLPWLALGVLIGALAIYLPFLIGSPGPTWRYVVLAQVHRAAGSPPPLSLARGGRALGLDLWEPSDTVIIVGLIIAAAIVVAACTVAATRLAALLVIGYATLLIAVTSDLPPHDPAVLAGPFALCVGAAGYRLIRGLGRPLPRRRRPLIAITVSLLGAIALLGCAAPLRQHTFHTAFASPQLVAAVATLPGCVTSDDVSILIRLNVLGRNLDRGCRLVVDYGGYAHDPPGLPADVRNTPQWQAGLLAYLSEGSGAFHVRNHGRGSGAEYGARVWQTWPVIEQDGRFTLRRPPGQ